MQQQSLDQALSTTSLLCRLQGGCGEPKHNVLDLLRSVGQVGTVLSVCWMMHWLV